MLWAEHEWEARKCRQCEGYLFNSLGCEVRESCDDKVRAMGRENYVRLGGVGCFRAGRRELKRRVE